MTIWIVVDKLPTIVICPEVVFERNGNDGVSWCLQ